MNKSQVTAKIQKTLGDAKEILKFARDAIANAVHRP